MENPNCSFQASSIDEVNQVRQVVEGRTRFKHIASHFCLRLICRTDKQRRKRWNMMDKGQETINKQLDVVNYLRQQILLRSLLKIQYSPLERFIMGKSKDFIVLESDQGNNYQCQESSNSDDENNEKSLGCG